MSTIETLWEERKLPIRDGLYMASGDAVSAALDSSSDDGVVVLSPFDIDREIDADPEWVTTIDITKEISVEDGGSLCCGEGSYGSEGFFARTRGDGGLMWVMYFEESNPFVEIVRTDGRATFLSTSGVRVTVDIEHPLRQ